LFELLKKLCNSFGVSGNEDEIRRVINDEIEDYMDEIRVDALGNLIAVKKGSGKKIMVAAHMDEIGIIATYVDDDGYIRFSKVGGVSPYYALSKRVRFENGILGVVFYEQELKEMKNLKLSNMYIDAGFSGKNEAGKYVKIGDTARFLGSTVKQGDKIISGSLDDRAGCAVLIESIKSMQQTRNEIHYVFTVQEELGLRGARTAAFDIRPDIAIALDVTATGDTPKSETMEVTCGKGPAVKIKDSSIICHPLVRNLIENSAKKINIPLQYEVLERGGSDPGSIHITAGGIPSGAISIPCRYVHSTVEMISLTDIENSVRLLNQCLADF
jgi:putative aminopeptidase FrvX